MSEKLMFKNATKRERVMELAPVDFSMIVPWRLKKITVMLEAYEHQENKLPQRWLCPIDIQWGGIENYGFYVFTATVYQPLIEETGGAVIDNYDEVNGCYYKATQVAYGNSQIIIEVEDEINVTDEDFNFYDSRVRITITVNRIN